jgi:hypothetical protein
MNTTIADVIAAGLAALTPVQATPTPPLGYGRTWSCAERLDANLADVDYNSTTGIAQATFRRWDCDRGGLPPDGDDAREYGENLRSWCNRGTNAADMRTLESKLEAEALKDDRIAHIDVAVTPTFNGALVDLSVVATITPVDPNLRTFDLVLAVTSADLVIKSIGGAAV